MDIWSLNLQLSAWTVMSFLCVSAYETLNMSCYHMSYKSMTCEWPESDSLIDSDVSLIFSSSKQIQSCEAIINPIAFLNITVRMKNYVMEREIWSHPHAVYVYTAVKASQPVLTVSSCTQDSINVSWRSTGSTCRLRYRENNTHTWTQALDSFPAHLDKTHLSTITDLQPFTVYRASVACTLHSGIWSHWSSDVIARTLERAPSTPPVVYYRVEKTDSAGPPLLHLIWKDLDLHEAGGHILGYQVSYEPEERHPLRNRLIQNITEVTALLVVEEGNCSVMVTAFNAAGYGPAAHLSVDTRRQSTLPSLRNLWVSSSFPTMKNLVVQWEASPSPSSILPVSHFVVHCPETRPSTCCWTRVGGASAVITALMEAVKLQLLDVTKTAVTAVWTWQRRTEPIRVNEYRVMLRKNAETQSLLVRPDQRRHTFSNLKPNTGYSLLLLADNVSRNIITFRTDVGDVDEVPVVAILAPLLLAAAFVVSVMSVYKYFFPSISSLWGSMTGKWLMDPNHQRTDRSILDIEDFQVTDVCLIVIEPTSPRSSEDDPCENTSLLLLSQLITTLDSQHVSDIQTDSEYQLVSLQAERQTHEATGWFPQKEEDNKPPVQTSHTEETVVNSAFHQLTNAAHSHFFQVTWEAECVNASFLRKADVETQSGHTDCSYLICEADYIASTCFSANAADGDRTFPLHSD
ncbi:hypothetical protein PAMP_021763 [Pampus punctatissimus]